MGESNITFGPRHCLQHGRRGGSPGPARTWPRPIAAVCLGAGAFACAASGSAEEAETGAGATFMQPLSIAAAQPLDFGTLAIPVTGSCLYVLGPDSKRSTSGGLCQFLGGDALPAEFALTCAANSLVQFQLIYTDAAPAGAAFDAAPETMAIDGAAPGSAYQVRPCDADGMSVVKAGGVIELRPEAPHQFSGPVGSIRLEIAYN